MQYILNQEEYDALANAPAIIEKKHSAIIADLCQMVADNKIMKQEDFDKWSKNHWHQDAPWKCIRSVKEYEHYCDCCPVKKICTYPRKNYSK